MHQWIIHNNSGLWVKKLSSINFIQISISLRRKFYALSFIYPKAWRNYLDVGISLRKCDFHLRIVPWSRLHKSYATRLKRLCDFCNLCFREQTTTDCHREISEHIARCRMTEDPSYSNFQHRLCQKAFWVLDWWRHFRLEAAWSWHSL